MNIKSKITVLFNAEIAYMRNKRITCTKMEIGTCVVSEKSVNYNFHVLNS